MTKVTDPVGVEVLDTVAVKVTAAPYVDGFDDEEICVVDTAAAAALNVTVNFGFPPNMAVQGLFVPEHVDELRFNGALQPANTEPLAGLALNVTIALLASVVISGKHVAVTVCDAAKLPVPPHEAGALILPVLGVRVTVPTPLPVNVRSS